MDRPQLTPAPQSSAPAALASATYASPVGRPPRWLLWLFPGIGDLSQNPLYIRLSGQGYGRRNLRRRLAGPTEFRATSLDWLILARPGLWPLILFPSIWAGMASLPYSVSNPLESTAIISMHWAFLLVTMRMVTGRPRHAVIHFFRRARLQGSGDELALAGVTPQMIRSAILAALLPRLAARIFIVGGCWAATVLLFYWQAGWGQTLMIVSLTLYFWFVTWALFCGLETFDAATALLRAVPFPQPELDTNWRRLAWFFVSDGSTLAKLVGPGLALWSLLPALLAPVVRQKLGIGYIRTELFLFWTCLWALPCLAFSLRRLRIWINRAIIVGIENSKANPERRNTPQRA